MPYKKGDAVKLEEMPTGCESSNYPINIGDIFIVDYVDGCCLAVSRDGRNDSFTINAERFSPVECVIPI